MKTERDITLEAWLSALAPAHGILLDTLVPASSDAGFRRYFRVGTSSGGTLIVMDAPPAHENLPAYVQVNKLMAAAANMGFSCQPSRWMNTPAAKGMFLVFMLPMRCRALRLFLT